LDNVEIYELLFDEQVSSDHARKILTAVQKLAEIAQGESLINDAASVNIEVNKKTELEINSDGSHRSTRLIEMSEEQSKDPEYLLQAHGYSIDSWELVSARNNIWNVYSKQDGIQVLYSSKITVKPKQTTFDPQWVADVLKNLELDSPKIKLKSTYNMNDKTLETNLADVHINKLCHIDETRNEYSMDEGIHRLWCVVEDIITKTKHYQIKKILFPFGQDMCNIDNIFNTTTKGTPQDVNVKYDVMYKALLENIIKIIHRLTDIAPVEVIYVGGNHDKLTSYTMTEAMYWHFLNNDNVEVDAVFNNRKYRLIGNTLLGFAHGADEKTNIIYCMQNDVPELWAKAKYREYHLSHYHKEMRIDEKNGIIIRYISSISGNDAWTHNRGFVGSQRKAQAFVWGDVGLEAIINSYV
jgi:hypothetical protein